MASKTEILTRQERIQEIVKCAKDPIYFIKTYMYIQHPMKGRVKFDLYPFQEDCIRDFNEYKYNIILKSRQLGLSTSTAAYCLWLAMFHRDKNIIIMATKLEVGKFMVGKIREAFQMIPKWLLEMLELSEPEAESVKYLRFSNGSKITAIPTSKDAGRGEAVSLLVVDEAAHIENLKELWLGIRPTLSTGGRAIVFSTPNGKGNYFHELWAGADTGEWEDGKSGFHGKKTGTNGFHPIKLPWTVHPERDEKWFENEAASMDQRGISQELLCSFESSGYTYFQQADIDHIKFGAQSPIMFGSANGPGNDLWIWKTPQPKVKYLIVADIARGDSEDYSTFHIIDMAHSDIAAEYMGKIPTDEFGVYLAKMGMNYNQALIVIEKNTYGVATGNKLRELRYPNLYYDPEIAEKMKYMLEEDKRKEIPGFQVTVKNRELALGNLEACIRNKQIRIYSTRFASQMESFIFNGKRGQALKGKNDDLIMAMAIGLQIFTPNAGSVPEQNLQEVSWQVAFLKGISRSNVDMNVVPGAYGTNAATYNPYSAAAGRARMANALKPASTFSDSEPEVLKPLEQYQGKTLPPGVKKDDVALQQAIFNEYNWLLK